MFVLFLKTILSGTLCLTFYFRFKHFLNTHKEKKKFNVIIGYLCFTLKGKSLKSSIFEAGLESLKVSTGASFYTFKFEGGPLFNLLCARIPRLQ